jgi:hypothetical protein
VASQSLYRKYRPQQFSELVGQEHVTNALRNAVRDGRVGHAYLFSGPRGTGKTTTARILAKALNCTNLGADGEPSLRSRVPLNARTRVVEVEQRLERRAFDEGHDEQRRDLRWVAGVLPQHLGNRHRGRAERPEQPGLTQHVTVADRREPGGSDFHDDASPVVATEHGRATEHGGIGEARRTAAERLNVRGPDRGQAFGQVAEVAFGVDHFSSVASQAAGRSGWWLAAVTARSRW